METGDPKTQRLFIGRFVAGKYLLINLFIHYLDETNQIIRQVLIREHN
jgi:hypothetical protein